MAGKFTKPDQCPSPSPGCADQVMPPTDWMGTVHRQLQHSSLVEDRREFGREEPDRRSADRLVTDAQAKLCTSMKEGVEGRLVDISMFGCRIANVPCIFMPGDQVWLKMDALQHWRGTVRWVDGERVGVHFDQPFYPAVVDHIVQSNKNKNVVCSKVA